MVTRQEKQMAGAIAVLSGLVLICIVILMSFGRIEYTEIGLCHSWIGSSIQDKGWDNGLHFIGFGNRFITFPSTLVTIGFAKGRLHDNVAGPLESRTIDGLTVEIECSFQYRLQQDHIYDVYNKFGRQYHNIFVALATEAITAQATRWTAAQWFHNITEIQVAMEHEMTDMFVEEAFTPIENFQLISVGLPDEYDTEIKRTEVARQDNKTAHAEFEVQETRSETDVAIAMREANQTNIRADAQGQQVILEMQAWITQYKLSQQLQAGEFANIYSDLGANVKAEAALTASADVSTGTSQEDAFMKYLYSRVIRDHPTDKSVITRPALTSSAASQQGGAGITRGASAMRMAPK